VNALDAFADEVHSLLHERALSLGVIDVAVEVDEPHLDGELLFADGPDMGFTFDSQAGTCSYCELVPPDSERWLEERVESLQVLSLPAGEAGDEARREAALALLQGMLDARRPLLRR
jgi:hypothetical protein